MSRPNRNLEAQVEQTWLAISIAAGVIFGFLISWLSLRSDRAGIYARGKFDGENERAALEERVQAKELRLQEIAGERGREQEVVEKLREENATLRAAQG